ncbi:transcription factor bHLH95 [Citrus sinensis]|nr:transcription factor bHLH95 [Citrus sinensis]
MENPAWAPLVSDTTLAPPQPSSSKSPKLNKKQETSQGSSKKRARGEGGGEVGKDGNLLKVSDDKKAVKVKEGESEHEIHIWTERERRKKMRNMFANLHSLLPQLPPKADKSSIVDEAVSYIKTLQQTLRKLQKQKLERLQGVASFGFEASAAITPQNKLAIVAHDHQQGSSSNLLGANSTDATNNSSNLLSVSPTYPVIFQTWTSSNVVLNICGDEAHISICSPKKPGMFSTICYVLEKHKIEVISAQVSSDLTRRMYMIQVHVNGASDQFSEALPVEEMYKQAASELMFWISSCITPAGNQPEQTCVFRS